MTKPLVIISYHEDDRSWVDDHLRPQLGVLSQHGHIELWDDSEIALGEDRFRAFDDRMKRAAVAVCLITAKYLSSDYIAKEEVNDLLERRQRDGLLIIPVLLKSCPWEAVPWLKRIQMIPRNRAILPIKAQGDEDVVFAEVASHIHQVVGDPKYRLPAPPAPKWGPPEAIDIARLPETEYRLFGRRSTLEMLDKYWSSGEKNLISLVAWGGVGKSTLVNRWLDLLSADNYCGAERVYGWSFYSQGTSERVTSADYFFNEALEWFGHSDPASLSVWEKGEKLAELVRQRKTLLILDGLEPLQSPHEFERGNVKDPALEMLLTQLARQNPGLCLITTRERLGGLDDWGESVVQEDLEQISAEAARSLLRVGGVRGTDSELEEVSLQFGPQALAIQLLAVYLHDIPGHPASAASEIPDLDIPVEQGKHARRVIAALEKRLTDPAVRELLRILGLFDRPASKEELNALREAPAIAGLTDHLLRAERKRLAGDHRYAAQLSAAGPREPVQARGLGRPSHRAGALCRLP